MSNGADVAAGGADWGGAFADVGGTSPGVSVSGTGFGFPTGGTSPGVSVAGIGGPVYAGSPNVQVGNAWLAPENTWIPPAGGAPGMPPGWLSEYSPELLAIVNEFPILAGNAAALKAIASMQRDPTGQYFYTSSGKVPVSEVANIFAQPGWTSQQLYDMSTSGKIYGTAPQNVPTVDEKGNAVLDAAGNAVYHLEYPSHPDVVTIKDPITGVVTTTPLYKSLNPILDYVRQMEYVGRYGIGNLPANYLETYKPTPENPYGLYSRQPNWLTGEEMLAQQKKRLQQQQLSTITPERKMALPIKPQRQTYRFTPPTRWLTGY